MLQYAIKVTRRFEPTDEFSWQLMLDTVVYRKQFVTRLSHYDGSKTGFAIIIAHALGHNELSQNILAELCETTTGSISRWSRGSAPSKLARVVAVQRIRSVLDSHVQEIERSLRKRPKQSKPRKVRRETGSERRSAYSGA